MPRPSGFLLRIAEQQLLLKKRFLGNGAKLIDKSAFLVYTYSRSCGVLEMDTNNPEFTIIVDFTGPSAGLWPGKIYLFPNPQSEGYNTPVEFALCMYSQHDLGAYYSIRRLPEMGMVQSVEDLHRMLINLDSEAVADWLSSVAAGFYEAYKHCAESLKERFGHSQVDPENWIHSLQLLIYADPDGTFAKRAVVRYGFFSEGATIRTEFNAGDDVAEDLPINFTNVNDSVSFYQNHFKGRFAEYGT